MHVYVYICIYVYIYMQVLDRDSSSSEDKEKEKIPTEMRSLQLRFLIVIWLLRMSDWLQVFFFIFPLFFPSKINKLVAH